MATPVAKAMASLALQAASAPMRAARVAAPMLMPSEQAFEVLQRAATGRALRDVSSLQFCVQQYAGFRVDRLAGLEAALDEMQAGERSAFFGSTLPGIVRRALALRKVFDSPPPRLLCNEPGVVCMTRTQAASVMANMFLCTLPTPPNSPSPSFLPLLQDAKPQEVAKLRCFLNYFARIQSEEPQGMLYIRRVALREDRKLPDARLTPLTVDDRAPIEDAQGCLQADFANKYIGGGVLFGGCVQEEIRFAINPECCVSMALCEVMLPHESIRITGAERFSNYEGYGRSLKFTGNHVDDTPRDAHGTVCTAITAIDAIPMGRRGKRHQLLLNILQREVQKAYSGFVDPCELMSDEELEACGRSCECGRDSYPTVATGNWGAGVFGGDKEIKALLQWAAASAANMHVQYHPFGDPVLARGLRQTAECLLRARVTANELLSVLVDVGEGADVESGSVLDAVRSMFAERAAAFGDQDKREAHCEHDVHGGHGAHDGRGAHGGHVARAEHDGPDGHGEHDASAGHEVLGGHVAHEEKAGEARGRRRRRTGRGSRSAPRADSPARL